ncbi:putative chlorophyll(ide) b reductase NYC1, chloroplastic [Apostasia shenzhenica]|uniref:Putative chlorophyll(Ide) b reductase NYC1, chloroplastic n=1 Tax=Apostasia shenzhenica TaxID=1088818 RepID=A0A2I0BG17_9ASPA|nr:putative chlorophyll(ide) b reductase NYC1, chloroplastic [Apostasia shenzhenica]
MGAAPPKTVMITGVSRGLGRALALELARRGHTVVGCARSPEKLQALVTELTLDEPASSSSSTSKHLLKHLDVRSDNCIKELAKLVVEEGKVPDIIVNNAGTINKNNKIWDVPAEEFDMVIDTNIKGIANVMRHFLPLMIERKRGVIINMSSGWGRSAVAEVAPYCSSKWAIEGLSKSVAKEVPLGLAIVALSPGVVNTDLLASCFGSNAALYEAPESWAPKAATMILNLTSEDNGASLTI